jgi:outer membrane cobalamin receptor
VAVTATRTPQRADEVIPDTTVISSEEIARAGAGSLADLLLRQRGAGYTVDRAEPGAEQQAPGSRLADAANADRLGGYGLLNLYTTWRFTPGWSLLLRLDNAADKRYDLARNDGTAGRNWFAALRYGIR